MGNSRMVQSEDAQASRQRKLKWGIFTTTLIIIGVILASNSQGIFVPPPLGGAPESTPRSAGTTHGTIRISSDIAFTVENGVVRGDGSLGDPYVIEGWAIDGNRAYSCIAISGTTKYFIVANCTLTNGVVGIAISSSENGTIANNTCTGNRFGISVGTSKDITIANNTCNNNRCGISLISCNSTQVITNNLAFNTNAIYLQFEFHSCTISANVIEYYVGLLYWGTPIRDESTGDTIDTTGNTLIPNWGGLNYWGYILVAYLGASICGLLLLSKIKKRREHQQATPGDSWQSLWRAQTGIALAELGILLSLPGIFYVDTDLMETGVGVVALFYTLVQNPFFSSNIYWYYFLFPAAGICVQFLLTGVFHRKARATLVAEIPKKLEAWEVKDLVRKVSRISLGGLAAVIISYIVFAINSIVLVGLPVGILFLLPIWVLFWRAHRKGETKFKAECVAQFKAKPDQAFAASLDLEFEAWASGGKKGKVETLPHEVVPQRTLPAPVLAPVSAVPPAPSIPLKDPKLLLLGIFLQYDIPNKAVILESCKQDLIDAFNLGIPPAEVADLKGDALIARLGQALRERMK